MKRQETIPENLVIGSVLLASGGGYLYNLFLGQLMGPESFAKGAQLITLLIALAFTGVILQVLSIRFGPFFEKNRPFDSFKTPYTCGIALTLILLTAALFHLTELKTLFPSTGWGSLMVLTATLPICLVKRLMPDSFFRPFTGSDNQNTKKEAKKLLHLVVFAAGYELLQIIIKNSDIMLVGPLFRRVRYRTLYVDRPHRACHPYRGMDLLIALFAYRGHQTQKR